MFMMIYVSSDTQVGQMGRLAIERLTAVDGLRTGKRVNTPGCARVGKTDLSPGNEAPTESPGD